MNPKIQIRDEVRRLRAEANDLKRKIARAIKDGDHELLVNSRRELLDNEDRRTSLGAQLKTLEDADKVREKERLHALRLAKDRKAIKAVNAKAQSIARAGGPRHRRRPLLVKLVI
jgi:hypothetical protein